MQVSTGQTFTADQFLTVQEASKRFGVPENDLVMVTGSPEAVENLSRSVRLGVGEAERRAKRRKQQRASRKKNR